MRGIRFGLWTLVLLCVSVLLVHALAADNDFATNAKSPDATAIKHFKTGKAALAAQDWSAAILAFEKLVDGNQESANAHNWLGLAYFKAGRLDAAFKNYEHALNLDPNNKGAHEYIGRAHLEANNLLAAEEHLAALASLCRAGCTEYKELKLAVDDFKSARRQSMFSLPE